jgi:micrococcal nuclease
MGACLGKLLSAVANAEASAQAAQAQHGAQPAGAQSQHPYSEQQPQQPYAAAHGGGGGGGGGAQALPQGVQYVIGDARVKSVPDGDTFYTEYAGPDGRLVEARVRLMGVDCPEKAQEFGIEARDIGRAMIHGRTVTLLVHTTDQYGRLVADVRTEAGTDYGQEMLRAGAAWHYTHYDHRPELALLMQNAKAARVGLWALPNPQPPWDYRRAHPRHD